MTSRQQSTHDLIENYYNAFNAGDRDTMLASLTKDVVHEINQGKSERGRDKFYAFLLLMEAAYREQLHDVAIMVSADGSRASAEFVVHGQYLVTQAGLPVANGQRYVLPAGAFFSVANGLISRVTVHYNLADWIDQVSN